MPGRGSRFALALPGGSCDATLSVTLGRGRPRRSRGALLLVIENEAAIREGMQSCCRAGAMSCSPHHRRRLPSACYAEAARGRRVIADYHLDGCTGADAIGMLRARFGTATPAMVITADRTPEVQQELDTLGVPLLNKPVRPAQLRSLLAKLLTAQRPSRNIARREHGLGPAEDAELAEYHRDVGLHRRLGDAELVGDDLVRLARHHQPEDVVLLRCQRVHPLGHRPSSGTGSASPSGCQISPASTCSSASTMPARSSDFGM